MYSIGDRLKDARMSKGLRVEDIQNRTNVRVRYIEAIEEGHLDILPGESYARTFVKLYAEEVGFDGEQFAKEFTDENKDYFEAQKMKKSKTTKRSRFSSNPDGNWATIHDSLPMIIVIGLLIAIVVAIYMAGSSINSDPDTPYIRSSSEETTFIQDSNDENVDQTVNFEGREDTTLSFSISGEQPSSQKIDIITESDTWTSIQVDGESVNDQLLQANETLSANIDEVNQMIISLGNSSDVTLMLNDEEIPFKEEAEDITSLEINLNFE